MILPKSCPHCNADLTDGPINENIRELYPDTENYSRIHATVTLLETERIIQFSCPDCGHQWKEN